MGSLFFYLRGIMKTYLKILLCLVIVGVIAAGGFTFYVFFVEKELGDEYIFKFSTTLQTINELSFDADFSYINSMQDFSVSCKEEINGKTSNYSLKKQGQDSTFFMEYKGDDMTIDFYIEDTKYLISQNGAIEEVGQGVFYESVLLYFKKVMPLEEIDGKYYLIKADKMKDINHVLQKGSNLTFVNKSDSEEYDLCYDYYSNKIVSYKLNYLQINSGISFPYSVCYVLNLSLGK